MKTVLLAEDEATTLRFYQTGLRGLQGWRLLGAENGQKALDLMRQESVDVLVTDLQMPIMDGFSLIAEVHSRYPSVPIIVLTSMPEGISFERARELGALKVLSKPVRLSALMEEIRALGEREVEGKVRGLNIGSLIQLMNWELKTSTLTVKSQGRVGILYVRGGKLIHATCAECEGLEAAYRILAWPKPEVEFVDTCRVQASISLPVPEILMNVALQQDTLGAEAPQQPDDPWGTAN
ncbi:MAG: Response regulator containing CheY-like receiver domain and AraC-type DNA-binding domain protein [Holophagaceae bacterium]|nr:Response regulator containing CheY-like receiver domain and AraC-type DNA-binding domain protein [Holophagaceae bacterium]